MMNKKIKLAVISLVTSVMIIVFFIAGSGASSPGNSMYEFSRGMLTGLSGVAAIVWLIFLISNITGSKKKILGNGRQVLLGIAMLCLLIGTIAAVSLSDNSLLLAGGSIITGTAIVLNIIYLPKLKGNVC